MATDFISTAGYGTSSMTTLTISKPANIQADDLMFAIFTTGYNDNPTTVPANWTLLSSVEPVAYSKRFVYYKIAGSSEPSSYAWIWDVSVRRRGDIVAYRGGFDTSDPIDAFSELAYTTSGTTLRAGSINVASANSTLIILGGVSLSTSSTCSAPTSQDNDWIEDLDTGETGSRKWQYAYRCEWSGSGASGNADMTLSASNTNKQAFMISLKQAGGAELTKVNGIAIASIAKYQGIAKASISKVSGLTIQ